MQQKRGTNWKFVLVVFAAAAIFMGSKHKDQAPVAQPQQPLKQYVKRNGTVDPRKDDLDELCKDYIFYKAKVKNATDTASADAAAKTLHDTLIWLSDYRPEDVGEVCRKYDPSWVN